MSKGYTISFFINTLTNTTNSTLNTQGVFSAVSPLYGAESVKAKALDNYLGGNAVKIATGKGAFAKLGKTPRTRLIKALKLRKKNGYVSV